MNSQRQRLKQEHTKKKATNQSPLHIAIVLFTFFLTSHGKRGNTFCHCYKKERRGVGVWELAGRRQRIQILNWAKQRLQWVHTIYEAVKHPQVRWERAADRVEGAVRGWGSSLLEVSELQIAPQKKEKKQRGRHSPSSKRFYCNHPELIIQSS